MEPWKPKSTTSSSLPKLKAKYRKKIVSSGRNAYGFLIPLLHLLCLPCAHNSVRKLPSLFRNLLKRRGRRDPATHPYQFFCPPKFILENLYRIKKSLKDLIIRNHRQRKRFWGCRGPEKQVPHHYFYPMHLTLKTWRTCISGSFSICSTQFFMLSTLRFISFIGLINKMISGSNLHQGSTMSYVPVTMFDEHQQDQTVKQY